MKKICSLAMIIFFMIIMSGCSKDPFKTAENYNQFTRTYMFSATDTNVTSRIDAERSGDDNITRDVMGSNGEVCLINEWARIGVISEGTTSYNDFYIYSHELFQTLIFHLFLALVYIRYFLSLYFLILFV